MLNFFNSNQYDKNNDINRNDSSEENRLNENHLKSNLFKVRKTFNVNKNLKQDEELIDDIVNK